MAGEIAVYRLHVAVEDITPPIWREIELTSNTTLVGLHNALQVLMGWHDSHLWAIEAGRKRYELPDPDVRMRQAAVDDPRRVTVGAVLAGKQKTLRYNYDFGDDWLVKVKVLSVAKPEPRVRYPRCLAGGRAGPPEDCGGPPGFERLLAARKNPGSGDARELLEWAGTDWNPEAFDLALINKALAGLPVPRGLH